MKKSKILSKKLKLHRLPYGRIAVMKDDPTREVNFVGEEDEDRKFD